MFIHTLITTFRDGQENVHTNALCSGQDFLTPRPMPDPSPSLALCSHVVKLHGLGGRRTEKGSNNCFMVKHEVKDRFHIDVLKEKVMAKIPEK